MVSEPRVLISDMVITFHLCQRLSESRDPEAAVDVFEGGVGGEIGVMACI